MRYVTDAVADAQSDTSPRSAPQGLTVPPYRWRRCCLPILPSKQTSASTARRTVTDGLLSIELGDVDSVRITGTAHCRKRGEKMPNCSEPSRCLSFLHGCRRAGSGPGISHANARNRAIRDVRRVRSQPSVWGVNLACPPADLCPPWGGDIKRPLKMMDILLHSPVHARIGLTQGIVRQGTVLNAKPSWLSDRWRVGRRDPLLRGRHWLLGEPRAVARRH